MLVKMIETTAYSEDTFDVKRGYKDEVLAISHDTAVRLIKNKKAIAIKDPTADMSPFGAALFNCFKSSDRKEQLNAMKNLVGE